MHREKVIDGEKYISQREASRRLGVCQLTFAKIVSKGLVKSKKVVGVRSVWVRESDLVNVREFSVYGP